jgi:hypothetical protein
MCGFDWSFVTCGIRGRGFYGRTDSLKNCVKQMLAYIFTYAFRQVRWWPKLQFSLNPSLELLILTELGKLSRRRVFDKSLDFQPSSSLLLRSKFKGRDTWKTC